VGAYTLHIVVTRKIFKKVAGTMFPNKIVEISASPLRKPQLIRRGEQKISAIFSRVPAKIFRRVSVATS
jgi:hypothetical protein